MLTHAHAVHDDKVGLADGVGRHGLQVGGVAHAHAPAFHLLKEVAAFHGAHEHHNFHRFDVGAGGDHVHGDGNARKVAVAKGADQVLGLGTGAAVGDFLGKVVALAKLFAQDFDNFFGVVVVFGKHQGFGHLGAAGEDLARQPVAKGADDGANLVGGLHGTVQRVGVVGQVFVQRLPAGAAGEAVAVAYRVAGLNLAAGLGHLGADAVHVVIDVDAVSHSLRVAVFHDQVLVEEAKGLLGRGGGQADQVGVKVLQHLAPQVVDAAVRLVGHDDVKSLNGKRRVVGNGLGLLEQAAEHAVGAVLVVLRAELAPFQQAEQALDGADQHPRGGVDGVALQVLDDVFLAKLEVVVGRVVLVKLFFGLAGQVAPVHQKQHAARLAKPELAVDGADAGKGFAAAGGHLDQGAGLVGLEADFQVSDGGDLRRPQPGLDQRRHGL